ncbi:hypothetical protein FN846DRAFT_296391 [Sphaerosporella brunnea]|uniref:Uncharacterized protein n=1 Tax=Sphaerosporella brunnea TaxID=1250544 RepID=A0A5J5EK51_9PEZI|nr:hypothetical protein FN846DRAFT_296391 [Sphaerosporella brunnea]
MTTGFAAITTTSENLTHFFLTDQGKATRRRSPLSQLSNPRHNCKCSPSAAGPTIGEIHLHPLAVLRRAAAAGRCFLRNNRTNMYLIFFLIFFFLSAYLHGVGFTLNSACSGIHRYIKPTRIPTAELFWKIYRLLPDWTFQDQPSLPAPKGRRRTFFEKKRGHLQHIPPAPPPPSAVEELRFPFWRYLGRREGATWARSPENQIRALLIGQQFFDLTKNTKYKTI